MLASSHLKTVFEKDLGMEEYEESLIIFPLELSVMHFFTIRNGNQKRNLYLMLQNMNLSNYGFLSITYRKCVIETSVKGLNFDYIQITQTKRLRHTQEIITALRDFQQKINDQIKVDFQIGKNNGKKVLLVTFDPEETKYSTNYKASEYGLTKSEIENRQHKNPISAKDYMSKPTSTRAALPLPLSASRFPHTNCGTSLFANASKVEPLTLITSSKRNGSARADL